MEQRIKGIWLLYSLTCIIWVSEKIIPRMTLAKHFRNSYWLKQYRKIEPTEQKIYKKFNIGLTHATTKVEKSYDVPSTSWKNQQDTIIIQYEAKC